MRAIRMHWTIRLGLLGGVLSVAVLAIATTTNSAAQALATVSGVHANEEFCKAIPRRMELARDLARAYSKSDPMGKDATKRAKFFADWKALFATLVKTAPPSLASDAGAEQRDMNAVFDAQLSGDPKRIEAAEAGTKSPQAEARTKRIHDYCGFKSL